MVKQSCERRADRPGIVGGAKRVLQLAEDLRFAEYHRVEPAADAEQMTHRAFLFQRKQRFIELSANALLGLQPVSEIPVGAVVGIKIEFRPVAG